MHTIICVKAGERVRMVSRERQRCAVGAVGMTRPS